jgi:hypothetical protein
MPSPLDSVTLTPAEESAQHPAVRYRALCGMAIVSAAFGLASVLVFFSWFLAVIPAVGLATGWYAWKKIHNNREEMTGLPYAWIGMGLSGIFWLCGYGWLLFDVIREVPYGYERVEYQDLQPDPTVKDELIPPGAFRYQERKVFIKGYMAPTKQMTHIKAFLLCPAVANCAFCPASPKATEQIIVTLSGDLETEYTTRLVAVGGLFKIDPESRLGVPYMVEADFLR